MTSESHRAASARQAARALESRLKGLVVGVASHAAARCWPACEASKLAELIDGVYFTENPSRATRVRPIIPGEFDDMEAEADWTVAVRRRDSGGYDRVVFPALPNDLTEQSARVIALLIDGVFERLDAHRAARQ